MMPPSILVRKRRVVDDLGAAQTDVVHVDARIEQALLERLGELLTRQADVAADDDLARLRRTPHRRA